MSKIGSDIPVVDLQRHAQKHREKEERQQWLVAQQPERADNRPAAPTRQTVAGSAGGVAACCHFGQRERIKSRQETHGGTRTQLSHGILHARHRVRGSVVERESERAVGNPHRVDNPHHRHKAYRAPNPYRRKRFKRLQPPVLQRGKRYRVAQRNGGNVERDRQGKEEEQRPKFHFRGSGAVGPCRRHECRRNKMAAPQQLLRRDIAVGHGSHERRHEQRGETAHGIEPLNFPPQSGGAEVLS